MALRDLLSSRPASPPTNDPTSVVLFAPAVDGVLLQDAGGQPAWAVCKPGTWRGLYGTTTITLEKLEAMAAAYDPTQLDEAAINFDHLWGGPAHGWVAGTFVRDEMLWVVPRDLSEELAEGIRSGRWRRASIEIDYDYEPIHDWYLSGLAILGNAKPAVKALPPIVLADNRHVIHLSAEPDSPAAAADPPEEPETSPSPDPAGDPTETPGEAPPADPPPAAEPTEGDPIMSGTATETGAGNQPGAQPTGADATPETPTNTPPAGGASLAADRAALAEERRLAREERLAARRERMEAKVDRDLEALGGRIVPSERPTLRPLMIELACQEQPSTIQLAGPKGDDGQPTQVQASEYDALLASLRSRPDVLAALGGEIATEDGDAPTARNLAGADERRIALAHGISEEKQLELQRKYPGGFQDRTTN